MTEWRIVPPFPDYEVSSDGEVRRRGATVLLKARLSKDGYRLVTLMKPATERCADSTKNYTPAKISRLVCLAFLGAPVGRLHAAHGNGDRADDRLQNLRWATPAENGADQYLHGTRMRGVRSPRAKLNDASVAMLRQRRHAGATWASLASEFGISSRSARSAASRKTWKHV